MTERQKNSEFLKTKFSWGLILKLSLEEIDEIKQFLASRNIQPVYQTVSAARLWVIEKNRDEVQL